MASLAGSALTQTGDNIKTGLNTTEWEGADWSHLAQDMDWKWSLMITVLNCWVL